MSFLRKAQQHVAHTSKLPALGNQDLRQLQDVITSEKNFIHSNARAANEFKKNAEAIKTWCAEEGADLNDVVAKLSLLYEHYSASQNRLNTHLGTVRLHFKSVRTREEALAELKARRRSLGVDIEKVERKLAKMGPENKELMRVTAQLKDMRAEMDGLSVEVMNEQAAIGDFKRRTVREALGIKSGALLEMAEKVTILAEISKLMLEQIPLQPTQPGMPRAEYSGFANTESLLQEATRCIADVGFSPIGPSAGIPRFGDITLADTTANDSRDISHSYANPDAETYHDLPTHTSTADTHPDIGYNASINKALSTEDVARTPIYAQHASRSQWTPNSPALEHTLSDTATNEWAQTSYERGDAPTASAAAAAAMAATAGADLNAVPAHGDANQAEGGGCGGGQQYVSNPNSVDYHSAPGAHAGDTVAPVGVGVRTDTTEPVQSDAYDGYNAGPNPHTHHETASNSTPMLSAPTLPPLRTATPLNSSTNTTPPTVTSPTSYTPTTTNDDSAYFQSIGGTRALQEAVRRPISPAQNPNRMSSYGPLGIGSTSPIVGTVVEGKKVTAAAFRRGFPHRTASNQTNLPITPNTHDETWNSNPLPQPPNVQTNLVAPMQTSSGGYDGGDGANGAEGEALVQPLHIQKRNSNSHGGLASTTAAVGGRFSGELSVGGSDNPAPPYLHEQSAGGGEYGQQHMQHMQQAGGRQESSRYAEYAAPPPPGYGYA